MCTILKFYWILYIFSTFLHNYNFCLNVSLDVLNAFLSHRNMLPVRVSRLQLLLSPCHLLWCVCHQQILLSSERIKDRLDPGPDWMESGQSVLLQRIWSDFRWEWQNLVWHCYAATKPLLLECLFCIICQSLVIEWLQSKRLHLLLSLAA